jgi:hypothetical protein
MQYEIVDVLLRTVTIMVFSLTSLTNQNVWLRAETVKLSMTRVKTNA